MSRVRKLISRIGRAVRRILLEIGARIWIRLHRTQAAKIRAERAWLFGGNSGRAFRDNAAALYAHVRETRPQKPAYWVIDPDSPDMQAARAVGPVLIRGTLSTVIRARLAEAIVISHGVHDVPGIVGASEVPMRVRVGHGLTALKRTRPRLGHNNRSANAIYDLVPVASRMERTHKSGWGIGEERMPITGLPRFDTLLAASRLHPREAGHFVYMPTWRDEGAEGLLGGIESFLTNPKLVGLLENQQVRLNIVLHPNLPASAHVRLRAATPDGAMLQDPTNLQELLARADLLITDWSSVTWDMLYLDRPVVFYHVEPEAFDRSRGAYLRSADFPGPVVHDPAELIDLLQQHLSGDLPDSFRRAWRRRAFAYEDDGNCARVVAEMERRLAPQRGTLTL